MEEKREKRRRNEKSKFNKKDNEEVKATPDEIRVAKWMKKHVRVKRTKLLDHEVEYFTGSVAVEALLGSKFAEGRKALFQKRKEVVKFLEGMLSHKLFHRAQKIYIDIDDVKGEEQVFENTKTPERKRKKLVDGSVEEEEEEAPESIKPIEEEERKEVTQPDEEKKKRKIRWELHSEQVFVDGPEAYVWLYDPVTTLGWFYSFAILLGAVSLSLFPLWPLKLRRGVFYMVAAAIGFLFVVVSMLAMRMVIYALVLVLTGFKWHFWIFPNLIKDVCLANSFIPFYDLQRCYSPVKVEKKPRITINRKRPRKIYNPNQTYLEIKPSFVAKIEAIKEHDCDVDMFLMMNENDICYTKVVKNAEASTLEEEIDNKADVKVASGDGDLIVDPTNPDGYIDGNIYCVENPPLYAAFLEDRSAFPKDEEKNGNVQRAEAIVETEVIDGGEEQPAIPKATEDVAPVTYKVNEEPFVFNAKRTAPKEGVTTNIKYPDYICLLKNYPWVNGTITTTAEQAPQQTENMISNPPIEDLPSTSRHASNLTFPSFKGPEDVYFPCSKENFFIPFAPNTSSGRKSTQKQSDYNSTFYQPSNEPLRRFIDQNDSGAWPGPSISPFLHRNDMNTYPNTHPNAHPKMSWKVIQDAIEESAANTSKCETTTVSFDETLK